MSHKIKCSTCSKNLYYPHLENFLEDAVDIVCNYCRSKYQILYGKISELEIVERQTNASSIFPVTTLLYKFHLKTSKDCERIQFSISYLSQGFSLQNDDKIYIIYVISKFNHSKKLACIQNSTNEKIYVIFGKRQVWAFRATACIAPIVIALVISSILPANVTNLVKISSILVGTVTGVFAFRITDFTEPNRRKLSQLSDEQKLLSNQYQLEERVQPLCLECEKYQSMLQQMHCLKQSLQASGEDLYNNRIEVVSQGIKNLETALSLTQTLTKNYAQLINMLAIEYRTLRLAEKIPIDTSESILKKLSELKKIEDKIQELVLKNFQNL